MPHIPGSTNRKFRPITVFLGLTGIGLFITIYAVWVSMRFILAQLQLAGWSPV